MLTSATSSNIAQSAVAIQAVQALVAATIGGPDSGGNSTVATLLVVGWVTTDATAGNLVVRAAQVTSDAVATIVRAGSAGIVERVA
jgi:hypothetical protein